MIKISVKHKVPYRPECKDRLYLNRKDIGRVLLKIENKVKNTFFIMRNNGNTFKFIYTQSSDSIN